jgi:hypothetical protein
MFDQAPPGVKSLALWFPDSLGRRGYAANAVDFVGVNVLPSLLTDAGIDNGTGS